MGDARRFVGVRLASAGYDYVQHVAARDKVTFSEALRRLLTAGATTDWETHANGHRSGPHDRAERGAATGDVGPHEHPDRDLNGDRRSEHLPGVPQPAANEPAGQPADPGGDDEPASHPGRTRYPGFARSDIDRIEHHIRSGYPGLP